MNAHIKKSLALCLIALCLVSTLGLCLVESSAKWFLMGGNAVALTTLFYCFFRPWQPATDVKPYSPNPPQTNIPSDEAVVPQPDWQGQIDELQANYNELQENYNELQANYNELQANYNELQETTQKVRQKQKAQQESLTKYKEICALLSNFEENRIRTFEERLEKIESEPSEEELDNLLEEFVDIALLAMDFVNTQTRLVCSYTESTLDLINNEQDKQSVISSSADSSTRLSNKYKWLSAILQAKLPNKSFFYSGYKL